MKILLKIVLIIAAFKAAIVFLLLISAIVAWLSSGGDGVLLPGLGLVIAMPLVIMLLLAAEFFLVAIMIFIWRSISKNRLQ